MNRLFSILFLPLIVVLIMAIPRILGTPWHAIAGPNSVREYDGLPLQYESYLLVRTSNLFQNNIIDTYETKLNSDEYRSLIPIYFMNTFISLGLSPSISFHATDVLFWWIGSVGTYGLARHFQSPHRAALMASVLTASSPLGVAFIGGFGLHTAQSMSLTLFLFIIFHTLHGARGILNTSLIISLILLASQFVYNYYLFLIPLLICFAIMMCSRRTQLIIAISVLCYVFISFVLFLIADKLFTFELHFNSPSRMLLDRIHGLTSISVFISSCLSTSLLVSENIVNSFHIMIFVCGCIGAMYAPEHLKRLSFLSLIIIIFESFVYNVPWVAMSLYPFCYICAGLGICKTALSSKNIFNITNKYIYITLETSILLMLMCVTNTDLIGDASFAIRWWQGWYVPR